MATRKPHKKNKITLDGPSRRSVTGTYDAASSTPSNTSYWQYTDALSAVDANSETVRKTLRERARFEFDNNTYCQGILKTIAKDTVGKSGPRLRMVGDTAQHKKLEADYTAWQKEVKYAEKLRNIRMARAKDGEVWIMPVSKKTLKNPVKLYFQLFETEQVGSYRDTTLQQDGVYTDEYNEASAFNLFDEHPGSSGISMKGRKISVTKLIQYAYMTRPGQLRGIPEITPALPLFVQLRAYSLAVLASAETAANLSAVLTTTAGAEDECDDVDAEYEFDISRNSIKTMPFGWGIQQLRAEQPTTAFPEAKREWLNEIARVMEVPQNIATLNSSGYNYASGRLDFQEYWKALDVEQGTLDDTINDPMFELYAQEWKVANRARSLETSHNWVYDGRPHVDPTKEAKAETERLGNMTTNLARSCAKDGTDWQEVVDQRLIEEKYIADQRTKLGLDESTENDNEQTN